MNTEKLKILSRQLLPALVVFILVFGVRVYWFQQKKGINGDEALSVIVSSYNDYGWSWTKDYDHDKTYTGKEVREITFWDNPSIKNAFGDIRKLRKDTRDSPHTNMYYSLLRLSAAGEKTGDLHDLIKIGERLNLVLFILSFWLLFYFLSRLFDQPLMIAFALFMAFMTPGAVSNTLLFRPYQLQEIFFALMALVFLWIYKKSDNNEKMDSWKNLLLWALLIALVLDSGYFILILVLMYFMILLVQNFLLQKKSNISFLVFTFLTSVAFAGLLYCNYFDGLLGGRGKEALGKLGLAGMMNNLFISMSAYFSTIHQFLFNSGLLIVLLIAIILLFLKQKRRVVKSVSVPVVVVLLVTFIWSLAVMYFAPYKVLRYIVPALPLLSLWLVIPVSQLKNRIVKYLLMSAAMLITLINTLNVNNIDDLQTDVMKNHSYALHPDIPVVVLNQTPWKYGDLIPYLNDRQLYQFTNMESDAIDKLQGKKQTYLITEKEISIPAPFHVLKKESCANYFVAYLLEAR